ncbi:hypothetical protein IW261DRAFT_1556804 [Armillaria novae-zelandiae]|uniref:Uncharacterized protein n=1 Tax=Armillaria novae-zelandiae TaxID=153914 RepID=A0AA39PYW8_9AGAR|nr:hypothetical protein IW261DRAFT_1556804 [Armillaria novae-zelandiae]
MSVAPSEYTPSPGRASTTFPFSPPSSSWGTLPMTTFPPTTHTHAPIVIVQCRDPLARGLATGAVIIAIGWLIFTSLLILRLQKLYIRMWRGKLAGDDHEVLFRAPSDVSGHGEEGKALLGGVLEQELAAGSTGLGDDSLGSAEGEESYSSRKA